MPPHHHYSHPHHAQAAQKGSILKTMVMLVFGIIAIAMAGYWYASKGAEIITGEIPTIKADLSPTKARPRHDAQPAIPHLDKWVYSRLNPAENKRQQKQNLIAKNPQENVSMLDDEHHNITKPYELPNDAFLQPLALAIPAKESIATLGANFDGILPVFKPLKQSLMQGVSKPKLPLALSTKIRVKALTGYIIQTPGLDNGTKTSTLHSEIKSLVPLISEKKHRIIQPEHGAYYIQYGPFDSYGDARKACKLINRSCDVLYL